MADIIQFKPKEEPNEIEVWGCGECENMDFYIALTGDVICNTCFEVMTKVRGVEIGD